MWARIGLELGGGTSVHYSLSNSARGVYEVEERDVGQDCVQMVIGVACTVTVSMV